VDALWCTHEAVVARESRQVFGVGVESSRDRVAGRVCLVAWVAYMQDC
jgi:hypothetical protein